MYTRTSALAALLVLPLLACGDKGGGPTPAVLPTVSAFAATPASLPAGGGAVLLSWTAAGATSLAIDGAVGDVTGLTSKSVDVRASTTFTLTASSAAGSANKSATVTVAAAGGGDRYVDAAAPASNPCTQAAPCQTIAKAMAGAPAGVNVFLLDGSFGTDTQGTAAVAIADGVALRALHPGAAVLKGVALDAAGSTTVVGVVFDAAPGGLCARLSATSAVGAPTLTLTGVALKCDGVNNGAEIGTINLGGKVKATMTPGALAGGVYLAALAAGAKNSLVTLGGAAELLVTGGVFDGAGGGQPIFGSSLFLADGTSKLTLDGVTVKNSKEPVLFLSAGSAAILRNGALLDSVGVKNDCRTGGAIILIGATVALTMDHATLSGAAGVGICVDNAVNAGTLSFTQSAITGSGTAAIQTEDVAFGAGATVTADGLTLTNNGFSGLVWQGSTAGVTTIDLRNSTISANAALGGNGLSVTMTGGSLKLRGTASTGHDQYGVIVAGTPTVDLGKSSDPGGNTFSGNGSAGLRSRVNAGRSVDAVGNAWNAGQQGADASGHYSVGPLYTPVVQSGPVTSGANFRIDNGSTTNL